ncbi:hypothetical protein QYM36_002080 [Artemia franciscana]|uniref:Uncharacterized protein n=1 Tax=Artemia franciscana TaxID=6661 RepID=A0AA88LJ20_ARTSF|nr:hypothetical protein QYM36_002080 [Artemia franciscana]
MSLKHKILFKVPINVDGDEDLWKNKRTESSKKKNEEARAVLIEIMKLEATRRMMDSKDKRAKKFQYVAEQMIKKGVNLPSDLKRFVEMVETQWKNMMQRAKSFTDNCKKTDKATFNPVMVIDSINGQQKPASEFKDIEDEVEELLYHSNSPSTFTGV